MTGGELAQKIEEARNALIDAVMHLNEVNSLLESDSGDVELTDEDDLSTRIASLEEIAEILEELQSRYE